METLIGADGEQPMMKIAGRELIQQKIAKAAKDRRDTTFVSTHCGVRDKNDTDGNTKTKCEKNLAQVAHKQKVIGGK